ncbi:hypothetical protein [Streptomyces sp. NBC_00057]|uniref:hypothetical protein n=1 Tax=Streptomyces sp. NBC_00057 TaxID=2975634 RepID=UPI0032561C97
MSGVRCGAGAVVRDEHPAQQCGRHRPLGRGQDGEECLLRALGDFLKYPLEPLPLRCECDDLPAAIGRVARDGSAQPSAGSCRAGSAGGVDHAGRRRALVARVAGSGEDRAGVGAEARARELRSALDLLADALVSYRAYEERYLIEPMARFGNSW